MASDWGRVMATTSWSQSLDHAPNSQYLARLASHYSKQHFHNFLSNFHPQNLKRVVEVWFDDYKEYFYRSKPEALLVSPGNIEKQLQFRRTHNCRSFKWFMTEIAPDIVNKYPLPAANIHWGEVSIRHLFLLGQTKLVCLTGYYTLNLK